MHAKLMEDQLNPGPVHDSWQISFERYNGILGNQPTNQLPEPLLMQHFIDDNSAYAFKFQEELKDGLKPVYD